MFVIGLTGGIGSGKSTVSRWLSEHGIPIIDADQTVHELYDAPETIAAIAAAFGHGIVTDEGRINRRALGSIVFADDFALRQLEQILHPLVRRDMLKQQETIALAGQKVCIWDVPLLFEAGFHEHMDEIWVVWVPADTQKERVMRRDAFTLGEVELRMQAQFSLDEKRKKQMLSSIILEIGSKLNYN